MEFVQNNQIYIFHKNRQNMKRKKIIIIDV